MDDFVSRLDANTNSYYVFLGKHTEWADENAPDATTTSVDKTHYKIRNELLYSKRLFSTNTANMIRKVEWVANTAYANYDHRDDELSTKDFFVINTSNNVFKCLYNGANGYSTSEPTTLTTSSFETADGYIWKYLYSLSSANDVQFSTTSYIPVDSNTTVTSAAVEGTIDVILIDNSGQGYQTIAGTIQQKVSNTVFKIETSNVADNNYFTDSSLYITSGSSQGSLSKISNYVSNSSGRFIYTSNSLPSVDITSQYVVSPTISITGDGTGASAYCTVNTVSGAIHRVNMLNVGSDYSFANVNVVANTSYGNSAIVTAILAPPGGHGSNVTEELFGDILAISVNFSNNESNTISTDVAFRQAGIIENPLDYTTEEKYFTNTTINHLLTLNTTTVDSNLFTLNETIVGQTSNATAIVARTNSSANSILVSTVQGTFANSENIIGSTSSTSGIINSIGYPDTKYNSGRILYYDNFEQIQRSNTGVETVKLLLKF